jgi:hypothetical protein
MVKKLALLVGFLFSIFIANIALAGNSPVGFWKTIDDVTGRVKAIVQITESNSNTLTGTIVKQFLKPGDEPNCSACKGANHNKWFKNHERAKAGWR